MNLPEDKKQAVMESSVEKKWQMIKDMEKRRPQLPPKEYLNKFKSVMEEESLKVQYNYTLRKFQLNLREYKPLISNTN